MVETRSTRYGPSRSRSSRSSVTTTTGRAGSRASTSKTRSSSAVTPPGVNTTATPRSRRAGPGAPAAVPVEDQTGLDPSGRRRPGRQVHEPAPLALEVEVGPVGARHVVAVDQHEAAGVQEQLHGLGRVGVHGRRQPTGAPRHESRRRGRFAGAGRGAGGAGLLGLFRGPFPPRPLLVLATHLPKLLVDLGEGRLASPALALDGAGPLVGGDLELVAQSCHLGLGVGQGGLARRGARWPRGRRGHARRQRDVARRRVPPAADAARSPEPVELGGVRARHGWRGRRCPSGGGGPCRASASGPARSRIGHEATSQVDPERSAVRQRGHGVPPGPPTQQS